jgi:hypothetical protein
MLKMLAAVPIVGLLPLTNSVASTKKIRYHSVKFYTQTWKNTTIDLNAAYNIAFEKCKFINCKFKREDNSILLEIKGCYFENCGPLSLTNRKDKFTQNTWKHNIHLIGPAIPIEENNRRRANGEIA